MPDSKPDPDRQDFAALLMQHARGRTHDELSETFATLVREVMRTGKAGSLTYTVKVSPAKNVEDMVAVTDAIRSTIPQLDRPASMWFADATTGALSQDHPTQQHIFPVEGR